jgi:hypothetical protein
VGDGIFHSCLHWPWGPPSLLCSGYRVLLGVKQLGLVLTTHPIQHRGSCCIVKFTFLPSHTLSTTHTIIYTHSHTYTLLHKKFLNAPVNRNFLKGKNFYKGIHFCIVIPSKYFITCSIALSIICTVRLFRGKMH